MNSPLIFRFFEVKQQHFKTNLLNHLPSQFRSLGLDPKYETINNEFMGNKFSAKFSKSQIK